MAIGTERIDGGVGAERGSGRLFGVPFGDLGWFASLIMGLAAGFVAFFGATFVGIVVILILNASGHPADYTLAYRRAGLPMGLLVGVLVLAYLGFLWIRRVFRPA